MLDIVMIVVSPYFALHKWTHAKFLGLFFTLRFHPFGPRKVVWVTGKKQCPNISVRPNLSPPEQLIFYINKELAWSDPQ